MPTDFSSQMLDAITADFVEDGLVFEHTYDDLRHELIAQNDWACENVSDFEEVTLLQLLQASRAKVKADGQDPVKTHIHQLIEYAFIEQAAHGIITDLFPTTHR